MSGNKEWQIYYYPKVLREDIPRLDLSVRNRLSMAIKQKLGHNPLLFGKPLRSSLSVYRSLRVGDWRVIYEIKEKNTSIEIIVIGHRRDVYSLAAKRL